MSVFTILWLVWVGAFGAIEGTAIATKNWHGTLSDNLRALFHTNTTPGRYVWLAVGGAGCAWFLIHIAVAKSL